MKTASWLLLKWLIGGSLFFTLYGVAAHGENQSIGPEKFVSPPGMRPGLEILVDGRPLPTINHAGKTFVPVPRLGVEYSIRVWNHGPRRIAAIVSVDGLSVIDGQPATVDSTGYLVSRRGNIVIRGWRRDMDTVAAFSFQEREKSYATLMGQPENIGMISLLAIEEMAGQPVLEGRSALQRSYGDVGDTGTGYGRDVDSRTYYVPFVRSHNMRIITFYYDTVENLRRAGVHVDRPYLLPTEPKFAPRPRGPREL